MKLKRIFVLALSFLLLFSLIACNSEEAPSNDTPDAIPEDNAVEETTTEEATTAEEPVTDPPQIETKTYKIGTIVDRFKVFGRASVSTLGLACDHTAAGVEFRAYVEGKITILLNTSGEAYFTLYVDGVRSDKRLKSASGAVTFELGDFETGGVHTFRLLKQTDIQLATANLYTISFTGYFLDPPKDNDRYIEFIGDSLTVGYGNLFPHDGSNPGTAVHQDGTQTFAYLAAQKLGADHSMVAVSGIGLVLGYRDFPMKDFYAVNSYYRSKTVKFEPTRIPDVVVINLGTNDQNKNASIADWKAGVTALIQQVRTTYGKDVPIVWAYNMMNPFGAYLQATKDAVNALGGEAAGIYLCQLTTNKEGGNGHPSLAAHQNSANELASFLKEKKIYS